MGLIVLGHDHHKHISEMARLQEEVHKTGIVVPIKEEHSDRKFIGGMHIIEMINPMLDIAEEYYEQEQHWTPGKTAPMKRGKRK